MRAAILKVGVLLALVPGAGNAAEGVRKADTPAVETRVLTGYLGVRYQQLVITDDDIQNDIALLYDVGVTARLGRTGLSLALLSGLTERLVAAQGESGIRIQDSALSMDYAHVVRVGGQTLILAHGLRTWFPSSRFSFNQGLIMAPTLSSSVRYEPAARLAISVKTGTQYRWYRYAEQAGRFGGMNTQWVATGDLGLAYTILKNRRAGHLLLSSGIGSQWRKAYDSRSTYESVSSDAANESQRYTWSAGIRYQPMSWLTLKSRIQHGSPLRRNGIISPRLFSREETLLAFGLSARY